MTTSEVIYVGDLSTEATHSRSQSKINTDAPVDNNGLGRTFSPTDLLATSLASCMLTIMGIRANESSLDIKGTRARLLKVMASDPRRVSEIEVEITVVDRGLSAAQKTVLEYAAKTCPVAQSLSNELKQTVSFRYEKEDA
jgi:uncharacterized OsmC-like protein